MLDSGYRNNKETDNPWVSPDSYHPCSNCGHAKIHHYAKAQSDREHCMVVMYKTKQECSCNLWIPMTKEQMLFF